MKSGAGFELGKEMDHFSAMVPWPLRSSVRGLARALNGIRLYRRRKRLAPTRLELLAARAYSRRLTLELDQPQLLGVEKMLRKGGPLLRLLLGADA